MPTTDLISFSLAQTTPPAATPTVTSDQLLSGSTPAAGTSAPGTTPAPQQAPGGLGGLGMIPLIVLMVVVMMLMTTLTGRKEKKKRQALMDAMGKGDKVLTIGGQIGVIDAIRDGEVVLRIDENSNAKARFTKASIQQILESSGKGSDAESTSNGTIEVKTKGEKLLSAR
jgi:preprotein translocase subunit YajC